VVADRFDERKVWEGQLGFATRAPQNRPTQTLRAFGQLCRQPCLADPSLTAERDKAALAAVAGEQRILQEEQLLVSPDEPRGQHPAQHGPIVSPAPPAP